MIDYLGSATDKWSQGRVFNPLLASVGGFLGEWQMVIDNVASVMANPSCEVTQLPGWRGGCACGVRGDGVCILMMFPT